MRKRFEGIGIGVGKAFDIILNGENRPFRRIKDCQLLSRDPNNYEFIALELDESEEVVSQ
jgi:hypothetical protein